ncbi:hypothetical protein JZU46_05840 [bacterium]|nr:hypothetical protein [bacterium]
MDSIQQLKRDYEIEGKPHLRVGQYFVGKYIKKEWPTLFYLRIDDIAWEIIEKWLQDNQYVNVLPPATQSWIDYHKGYR